MYSSDISGTDDNIGRPGGLRLHQYHQLLAPDHKAKIVINAIQQDGLQCYNLQVSLSYGFILRMQGIIKLDKVFLLGKHITKNSILDGMLHSFLICQAHHLLYAPLPIHTYIISKKAEKIIHFV